MPDWRQRRLWQSIRRVRCSVACLYVERLHSHVIPFMGLGFILNLAGFPTLAAQLNWTVKRVVPCILE